MNIQTFALTVCSPHAAVFNFLADIENLPKWAGDYCERVLLQRGRWWALTADGDQIVEIGIVAEAGVIDLRTGLSPDRMTLTPIRVVALAPRRTLVSFVLIEAPDRGPEIFARRCEILRNAMQGLLTRFGGGQIHASENNPRWLELGLN